MICTCQCHMPPDIERTFAVAGVDVRHVIEAAVACRSCQNAHSPALLRTALPTETTPQSRIVIISPEGRKSEEAR